MSSNLKHITFNMTQSTTTDKVTTSGRQLSFILLASLLLIESVLLASGMGLFSVNYVDQNGSRLVATSNYNYALTSPKLALAKSWRTVSVNGEQVLATTTNGEKVLLRKGDLSAPDLALIEQLRDEIANSNTGYSHTSTASGIGPTSGFSISTDTSSTSSSSMSSTSSSFSSSINNNGISIGNGGISSNSGEMSYNMRDSDNFSVSRSDLPFNWSRVFFNGDLVTLVFRNGDVQMLPTSLLGPAELEATQRLKLEVNEMQRRQTEQMSNTVDNSMNMVSNVFNNIIGRFPRPPSYRSAVGNMFGDNFPFGPNNSPFDSAAGWPFGGGVGGGASAMAFASRRRR